MAVDFYRLERVLGDESTPSWSLAPQLPTRPTYRSGTSTPRYQILSSRVESPIMILCAYILLLRLRCIAADLRLRPQQIPSLRKRNPGLVQCGCYIPANPGTQGSRPAWLRRPECGFWDIYNWLSLIHDVCNRAAAWVSSSGGTPGSNKSSLGSGLSHTTANQMCKLGSVYRVGNVHDTCMVCSSESV